MTLPETLVVDASIAVKWYIHEHDSPQALRLTTGGARLIAPSHVQAEVGNVVWKRSSRGDITPDDARGMVHDFIQQTAVELREVGPLLPAALLIALRYERTVYDSLYLALAMREHCRMITADERLYNRLLGTEMEPYIMTLGQY